jgi:hypothetical protein
VFLNSASAGSIESTTDWIAAFPLSSAEILVASELDRSLYLTFSAAFVVLTAAEVKAATCAFAVVITFAGAGICPIFELAFVGWCTTQNLVAPIFAAVGALLVPVLVAE